MPDMNPTGKRGPKKRHPGEGTVIKRKDRYPAGHPRAGELIWRAKPWTAVVPYLDASGQRKKMYLSAGSRDEAEQIRKREVARLARVVPGRETVGDYVAEWLSTVEVGPGTWPRYRQHLTERIGPAFGEIPLDALTPQLVRRGIGGWSGAAATRSGALRLLRAAMKQAVADRRIEHDPTAGIPYPRIPRHEPQTLDAAQARHLMATVAGERFAPILVLSLGLGVRRGEALGLRTQDVIWSGDGTDTRPHDQHPSNRSHGRLSRLAELHDVGAASGTTRERPDEAADGRSRDLSELPDAAPRLDRAARRPVELRIAKSLRYISPSLRAEGEGPYRLTGTKTGESRTVPIPAFVADALAARLEERDREQRAAKVWAPNDLVFCDPVGNSIPLESLHRWFAGDEHGRSRSALARAGLPHMRWHELRASTITLLLEYGVDLISIQRIVGHKDLATTRRYVGKTPQATASAARRLDEALG